MTKVLSKAGASLADVYDVQGSIAGINQLESDDVSLVHEMGATIFSERLGGSIVVVSTGALGQNTDWNLALSRGSTPSRILGIGVINNVSGRVSRAQVSLAAVPPLLTDIPIFVWDSVVDIERLLNIQVEGVNVLRNILSPNPGHVLLPNLMIGTGQPLVTPQLTFRGRTLGFGAGTVVIEHIVYTVAAGLGGVSSTGLPLPSW